MVAVMSEVFVKACREDENMEGHVVLAHELHQLNILR
jgi:hypothetical protein